MINATYFKARRAATSLQWRKDGSLDRRSRLTGRTKGGRNTNLRAFPNGDGRAMRFFMTAGEVSDYTGAAELLGSFPKAEWL